MYHVLKDSKIIYQNGSYHLEKFQNFKLLVLKVKTNYSSQAFHKSFLNDHHKYYLLNEIIITSSDVPSANWKMDKHPLATNFFLYN